MLRDLIELKAFSFDYWAHDVAPGVGSTVEASYFIAGACFKSPFLLKKNEKSSWAKAQVEGFG